MKDANGRIGGTRPQTTEAGARRAGLVAELVQHVYGNFVVMKHEKNISGEPASFQGGTGFW